MKIKMKHMIFIFCLSSIGPFIFGSGAAMAVCIFPEEPGSWVNVDANTSAITKAKVRFQCQDLVINGELYPPGFPYYIHLFGKCHPTDCDWGEVGATRNVNGWLRTTINHGFAKRYVWAKAYPGASIFTDRLRIYIWTDFVDPDRQDYVMDEWFRRQIFFPPFLPILSESLG